MVIGIYPSTAKLQIRVRFTTKIILGQTRSETPSLACFYSAWRRLQEYACSCCILLGPVPFSGTVHSYICLVLLWCLDSGARMYLLGLSIRQLPTLERVLVTIRKDRPFKPLNFGLKKRRIDKSYVIEPFECLAKHTSQSARPGSSPIEAPTPNLQI